MGESAPRWWVAALLKKEAAPPRESVLIPAELSSAKGADNIDEDRKALCLGNGLLLSSSLAT